MMSPVKVIPSLPMMETEVSPLMLLTVSLPYIVAIIAFYKENMIRRAGEGGNAA